jgi:hypothetical protein
MTPSDLLVQAERHALLENAVVMGWAFARDGDTFVLGLPAKDGATYYLRPDCTGYPATPPAWHWFNPTTSAIDAKIDTPVGGNFLHGNGVICAPWNRLAYQSVDSRGRIATGRSALGSRTPIRGHA